MFVDRTHLAKLTSELIKAADDLSFRTLTLFARGLTIATRLLELPEPTIPEKFEDLVSKAVKNVESPGEHARDIAYRGNDISSGLVKVLQRLCLDEAVRRKREAMEMAILGGETEALSDQIFKGEEILETAFSSGLREKIWTASTLSKEQRYGLLEGLIKAARLYANHNPKVQSELRHIHGFLEVKFGETAEKMAKLCL